MKSLLSCRIWRVWLRCFLFEHLSGWTEWFSNTPSLTFLNFCRKINKTGELFLYFLRSDTTWRNKRAVCQAHVHASDYVCEKALCFILRVMLHTGCSQIWYIYKFSSFSPFIDTNRWELAQIWTINEIEEEWVGSASGPQSLRWGEIFRHVAWN